MYIREYEEKLSIPQDVFEKYNMESIAYFDIETTGFDRKKNSVILISLGQFIERDKFCIKQYFADDFGDEKEVLCEFKEDLWNFEKWCSYNGKAFDEPFIKTRMKKNNIEFESPEKHIDLYRIIRPYYKQLGMKRCNLKTVEKHIGIERDDKIDGGISVKLYFNFIESRDKKLKEIIMLHNYEDVLSLPKIFNIAFEVENNDELIREDCITKNQLSFLKTLIKENNIKIDIDIERISKKAASRAIDSILKGNTDSNMLVDMMNNSY